LSNPLHRIYLTRISMKKHKIFVETEHHQYHKRGQLVCGDTFLSRKLKEEKRVISVLSDGLGSGVKANVLSTMTATMALNYISYHYDLKETARAIIRTLPVCSQRKISYATFTIAEIDHNNRVYLVEYGNPPTIVIRDGRPLPLERQEMSLTRMDRIHDTLYYSAFNGELGDRIILLSDGITQSGIGTKQFPFGWGEKALSDFACQLLKQQPGINARTLARIIMDKALAYDHKTPYDDMTCGVMTLRHPRELLLITGPPIDKKNDSRMADLFNTFSGTRIICGGTTANIIARETGRKLTVNLKDFDPEIPATSTMEGADLVTEGSITLGKVLQILENGCNPDNLPSNGAGRLIHHFLNSDKISFLVGTKINEAHQDPNVPVELEIRRNLVKQITRLLETKYLKEVTITFI